MKARGGISVDLEWKDGKAVKAILTATIPGTFHVKMPEGVIRAKAIIDGQSNNYTGKTISLSLPEKGECVLRLSKLSLKDLPALCEYLTFARS